MRSVWANGILAVTLGVLVVPAGVRAADDTKTVQAIGQAAVVSGDLQAARERARKDALRNAVEQVAGANVQAVTHVKDYQLVSDTVTSRVEGFVKEFKVLDEKNEGGVITLRVEATVSKGAAQEAYALALMEAGQPKVAFVVAERMAGETDFSLSNQERGKTENMMVEYFVERNLRVVDFGGMTGVNLSGAASGGELSAADAQALAEKADAQFVVLGKVVGVDGGPIMNSGLRSYAMSLTLKMFSTNTHEIVATVTKTNVVPCTVPNLAPVSCNSLYKARVVEAASQELLEKTARSFVQASQLGSKRVQMRISVANFAALNKFMTALQNREISGVESAQQRSFKSGKAVVDVELKGGDTNALAAELSAKKVGGVSVEVVGVNPDQLELEIKK